MFVHPDFMLCPWKVDSTYTYILGIISSGMTLMFNWHLHVNHIGDTSDHHVSYCAALVVLHYMLKRPD